MQMLKEMQKYMNSENSLERLDAIKKLLSYKHSWQKDLLLWQVLTLLPSSIEKSEISRNIILQETPSSQWALISFLLKQESSHISYNCLAGLSHSKAHFLNHRVLKFIQNRVLTDDDCYALSQYSYFSRDKNYIKNLIDCAHSHMPTYILSAIINTLHSFSIADEKVQSLCFELLNSQSQKNYLNNSSIISGIFYLYFTLEKNGHKRLLQSQEKMLLDELKKLLSICEDLIRTYDFDAPKGAEAFFENSLTQKNPPFVGYRFFPKSVLCLGLKNILKKKAKAYDENLTRSILLLGDMECIKILEHDERIGIESLIKSKNKTLLKIWLHLCSSNSTVLSKKLHDPKLFYFWQELSKNDHYTLIDPFCFIENKSAWDKNLWQPKKNITQDRESFLCFKIACLEKLSQREDDTQKINFLETDILDNIEKHLKKLKKEHSKNSLEAFIDKIYGTVVGGDFSLHFFTKLYYLLPFSGTSWAFSAIALTAPKLEYKTLADAIQREIEIIKNTLEQGKLEKDDYILEVTSRFQSILVGSYQFKVQITEKTLNILNDLSRVVQNILDTLSNDNEGKETSFDDKPILRWNAILQVFLNPTLNEAQLKTYETSLIAGLRTAPHLEKRWIVRALIKIDSNEAIKTVVSEGLQSLDKAFVEQSALDLISSKHPRAIQALIHIIGREEISEKLKLKILENLETTKNPEDVIQELKSLLLMRHSFTIHESILNTIAKITPINNHSEKKKPRKENKVKSFDIDLILKKNLSKIDKLSLEVRSALRTAEMIYQQSQDWGKDGVDLSPIVNMYSKSVEITMRELFEPYVDNVVRKSSLSRKLDKLGYNQNTQEKMAQFEDKLSSLELIKDIPHFSKFKLRKMLRAICLFRPGRRFTLDGPKAFALFFLITARKNCSFGLSNIMTLPFEDDLDLFKYIKLIHELQDLRNRAIHEGLTWEEEQKISHLRQNSFVIINSSLKIFEFLKKK